MEPTETAEQLLDQLHWIYLWMEEEIRDGYGFSECVNQWREKTKTLLKASGRYV